MKEASDTRFFVWFLISVITISASIALNTYSIFRKLNLKIEIFSFAIGFVGVAVLIYLICRGKRGNQQNQPGNQPGFLLHLTLRSPVLFYLQKPNWRQHDRFVSGRMVFWNYGFIVRRRIDTLCDLGGTKKKAGEKLKPRDISVLYSIINSESFQKSQKFFFA